MVRRGSPFIGAVWLFALVCAGYTAGALAAFGWFGADVSPVFFPAAGVSLAALVLTPRNRWPVVLAAAALSELVVDLTHGGSLAETAGWVVANTAEPLIGASLLLRFAEQPQLGRRADLLAYLAFPVALAPAIGGAIAATSAVVVADAGDWPMFAGHWWIGDGLGVLVVGGLILALAGERGLARQLRARPAEATAVIGAIAAATVLTFATDDLRWAYVPMILCPWAAIRLGTQAVTIAGGLIATITAQAVGTDPGFWAHLRIAPHDGLLYVQLGLGVLIATALLVAAEVGERERAVEQRLRAERAERRAAALHGVTAALADAHDPEGLPARVAQELADACGARRAALFLRGDGGVVQAHRIGPAGREPSQGLAPLAGETIDSGSALTAPAATGGEWWTLLPLHGRRGCPGAACLGFAASDEPDHELLERLARQAGAALERAEVARRERAARARAELLTSVLSGLDSAGGLERGAQRLVELLVPRIADVATIEAPGAGTPPIARAPADGHGAAGPPEAAARAAAGEPQLLGATVAVPLPVRGAPHPLALLVGRSGPPRRPFDEHDLELVRQIASRAAVTLENAWTLEQEHQIAIDLQRALLPEGVLANPGVTIAARYRPGDDRLQVGGDWYETIDLPRGRIGVAVGDVVGHGLPAAAAMGQLRTAVSALAPRSHSPADLLDQLDTFAEPSEATRYGTAAYAVVDPATGSVRHASAGHVPLLLISPGEARFLTAGRSWPLCVRDDAPRRGAVDMLCPGDTLLLYSDGLIERREEPIDVGLERLAAVARRHSGLGVEALCDRVIADLTRDAPIHDDIVVVALRLAPMPLLGAGAQDREASPA